MPKTKRTPTFAALGLLAGGALVALTVVSPPNIQAPLVALLLAPAGILHALRLDFIMGPAFSPNATDDVGFGALFLFTAIIWPVIGAVAGGLIAHFTGQKQTEPKSHA